MTTVEKIHNEIDTAQDRLYKQALDLMEAKVDDPTELELKAERLKKLGFNNNEVKAGEKLSSKRKQKEEEIVNSKEQAELIKYYKQTYPFLKFITESELDRICDKYGLIHAPVANYQKPIPDKNLKEIENSQELKEEDVGNVTITECFYGNISKEDLEVRIGEINMQNDPGVIYYTGEEIGDDCIYYRKTIDYSVAGLFIAAPKSHFNLDGLEQKDKFGFFNKSEPPDPVVYRYVRGGIQVLSKWGDESEDESLINEMLQ